MRSTFAGWRGYAEVVAGWGRAVSVGRLSVPPTWPVATPVSPWGAPGWPSNGFDETVDHGFDSDYRWDEKRLCWVR